MRKTKELLTAFQQDENDDDDDDDDLIMSPSFSRSAVKLKQKVALDDELF
jgi:hypothetical protein